MRSKFILLLTVIFVCTAFSCTPKNSENAEPVQQEYSEPNYYYDFDDILIPRELTYEPNDSNKLDNSKFRAAIMAFSGRVVTEDVINFFINNMAKDNWELIYNVKQNKQTMLSFEKHNKSAIIQVTDNFAKATVTVFAVESKMANSTK